MCNTRKKRVKEHQGILPQSDTQHPMKEPVSVSVSIQTDKDTRKSMDQVSEQERQEPLCLSCLGIPFRHSRNTANLRGLMSKDVIIWVMPIKCNVGHCRAVRAF